MARKKKTKSWKDTYEFYGIKNYTWSKSWKNVKKNGLRSQISKEWGMIGKALKSGKLSYKRFVLETLVMFAVGFGIGCLIGELVIWVIS
jgi:hypothetical protein|tara:strand:+ start:117 stop:383 length:267 start_codon:yes stop_codon:yes gene_type:complete